MNQIVEKARELGRRFTIDMRKSTAGVLEGMDRDGLPAADVEKRNGLIVKRPVLNAAEWAAWATKHGVPAPVPADKLHCTIIYSSVDVKVKPLKDVVVVDVYRASFAMLGENEDAFCVCFDKWVLFDRFWDLLEAGATHSWPSFRSHVTFSYAAAGFEISDEALAEAPDFLVLGGEVYDEPREDWATESEIASNVEGLTGEAAKHVDVDDETKSAAAELIKSEGHGLNPVDAMALYEIAKTGRVAAGALARLTGEESALPEADAGKTESSASREVVVGLGQNVAPALKAIQSVDATKAVGVRAAEQMGVFIASVSTVAGELIKDLHGDKMTTQALTEFSRDLMRGTRAGQFDHNGDNRHEVVQSLMLSDDIQKALNIDLGFEPYLVEIHFPDPDDWAEVEKGEWGASIRGTMYYEEDEDE
jgi:hypothetical protein